MIGLRVTNKRTGRGRCVSGGRRMGCSSRRVSVSRGLWGVDGDALRERNLLEATETGFFEC